MAQAERQDRVHAVGLNISHDRLTINQCQAVKVKTDYTLIIPVPRKTN